jgi:lysophospholipase L1-like esterase
MSAPQTRHWLVLVGLVLPLAGPLPLYAAEDGDNAAYWVEPMAAVHARFTGEKGTFAQFGDSITSSMAFWAPLRGEVEGLSPEAAAARERVADYMLADCWAGWKSPEHGNQGSMTVRWAHENVDEWLARLNPEVALIMFGTNDLGELALDEYTEKTRDVVHRCMANGTVVILNTIPPRSGRLAESREFAEAVARIAREEKVPLVDYFAEVLRRRPGDWDGSLEKFRDAPGDEYQVPTLISRDGVHPSHPRDFVRDFSEEGLSKNGYGLRSYMVLRSYSQVIDRVLDPPAGPR